MQRLLKLLPAAKAAGQMPEAALPLVALDVEAGDGHQCTVIKEGEGEWRLSGERIEKAAAMTNWDYAEAQVRRLRHPPLPCTG